VITLLIYSENLYHTLYFINISCVFVWDNSKTCKNQGECHSMTLTFYTIILHSFLCMSFIFWVSHSKFWMRLYRHKATSIYHDYSPYFFPFGSWGVYMIYISIFLRFLNRLSWRNKMEDDRSWIRSRGTVANHEIWLISYIHLEMATNITVSVWTRQLPLRPYAAPHHLYINSRLINEYNWSCSSHWVYLSRLIQTMPSLCIFPPLVLFCFKNYVWCWFPCGHSSNSTRLCRTSWRGRSHNAQMCSTVSLLRSWRMRSEKFR
jgi:hypothetical protein